jgi:PTH1 family peptidyl-tRNA hydrolase
MSSPVLIVGLGNPGAEYVWTRHNAGAMALDELADRMALRDRFKAKFHGEVAAGTLADRPCVLLRPETFMNDSGRSVGAAASFYRVSPADVVVLHDELDLPFGQVRVKVGGGHAGHNGLRSIIASLGTADFARVRMGIGRPGAGFAGEVADYVLSSFSSSERAELPPIQKLAADAVAFIAGEGIERAMNRLNTRPAREPAQSQEGSADGAGGGAKSSAEGRLKAAAF